MQALACGIFRYFLNVLLFYWICFTFPFPLDLVGLPFQLVEADNQPAWMKAAGTKYGEAYSWITEQKNQVCTRVGDRVLHVEAIIQPTGSGDTMRAYVGCLCAVVIAAVAALLWTVVVLLVQRRRPDWHADHTCTHLSASWSVSSCARCFSATVLPRFSRSSSPNRVPFRLAQHLGDMSPMGLLWTFMGFSPTYQIFTGAIEVLAGLLLTTRRTTLLGALVTLVGDDPHLRSEHVLRRTGQALFVQLSHDGRFSDRSGSPAVGQRASTRQGCRGQTVHPAARQFQAGSVGLWCCERSSSWRWFMAKSTGAINGGMTCIVGRQLPVSGRWDLVSMQVDKKEPGKDDSVRWSSLDFSNRKYMRLAGPKPPTVVHLITWDTKEKNLTLDQGPGSPCGRRN